MCAAISSRKQNSNLTKYLKVGGLAQISPKTKHFYGERQTYSYQVTSICDQYLFSYCADKQTHTDRQDRSHYPVLLHP